MEYNNPWPGPLPYEIGSAYDLYGRGIESCEIAELIQNNVFLTLYGKSGIGKTSLLNKGVIPLLGDDYVPISIRLRDAENYIECICENVANEKKEDVICHSDMNDEDFLWNWFIGLENLTAEKKEYVIILDQFEEVLKEKHKENNDEQIQQLNSYGMPIQESKQRKDKVDILLSQFFYMIRKVAFYNSDYICHFLISIREDDLYLLEDRIDENYLYDLKNYRYRLRCLTSDGAKEVVAKPGEKFFHDTDKAANTIVDKVKEASSKTGDEISSMILSLLCSRIYDENYSRYLEKNEKIPLKALEKIEATEIIEKYFEDTVKYLNESEKKLLGEFVDPYDRRLPIPYFNINEKGEKEVSGEGNKYKKLYEKLNNKLLRQNGDNIELIHDIFCVIISRKKKEWLREEEIKEKRRKERNRLFFVTILVIVFGALLYYVNKSKIEREAKENYSKALSAYLAFDLNDNGGHYEAEELLLNILPKDSSFVVLPIVEKALRALSYSPVMQRANIYDLQCAVYSPDGSKIVSRDAMGTIRIWDSSNGRNEILTQDNEKSLGSIAFSPDGSKLLSISKNTIKIWNIKNKLLIRTIKFDGVLHTAAFHPNSRLIVSAFNDSIVIIDAHTGKSTTKINNRMGVRWAEFCKDGQTVIGGSVSNEVTRLVPAPILGWVKKPGPVTKFWDARTGKELKMLKTEGGMNCLSPDERRIVTAQDSDVIVWDVATDTQLLKMRGHKGYVRAVSFSPDGKKIVSSSDDHTIKIWDGEYGTIIRTLEGHKDVVNTALFSPDGKTIVSASGDGTMGIWGNMLGEYVLRSNDGWNGIAIEKAYNQDGIDLGRVFFLNRKITYSPYGNLIAAISNSYNQNYIRIWNAQTGTLYSKLPDDPFDIAISPDGKLLASISSWLDSIKIWNLNSNKVIHKIPIERSSHYRFVPNITFGLNNILAITKDSIVYIWDIDKERIDTLKSNGEDIRTSVFRPDGKRLVVVGEKNLYDIDVNSRQGSKFPIKSTRQIDAIAFSKDGNRLAYTSTDSVFIWDFDNRTLYRTLCGFSGFAESLEFSPDGQYIYVYVDGEFTVWNIDSELIVARHKEKKEYDICETKLFDQNDKFLQDCRSGDINHSYGAISPDGRQFAYTDGLHILLWNYPSTTELIKSLRKRHHQ